MAFISETDIENIRSNVNIVDIISSYVPLTLKGKNYFGVCPFHDDHSPSMSVSTDKQIYKCFSCGAVGNVFTFVKEIENISFQEAVKEVANKAGLNIDIKIDSKKPIKNKEQYSIMDLATKYWNNNLNAESGANARKYLADRKMDAKTIKTFDIGYANNSKNDLANLLMKKGYDINIIYSLGLINKDGDKIYDSFIDRIIFPIHDLDGNPVGFTGRIYKDDPDKKLAKYYNSKESLIFKKGQILFNYHRAKDQIKIQKQLVVVEGNMDAIRVYSEGIKNVVALMGTAFTKEQLEIIKKCRCEVILVLDSDNAGQLAAFNVGEQLRKYNINTRVVTLVGAKDPDEYIIKYGIDKFRENIKYAPNYLEYKINYLKNNKDLNNTEDLVKYIKDVIKSLDDVNDALTREITIQKLSKEYNIPIELLKSEIKEDIKINNSNNKPIKTNTNRYDKAAQNILYFMMNDKNYIKIFNKQLGFFDKKIFREIFNVITYYYEKNRNINLADFITYISNNNPIYDDAMEIINNNSDMELNETFFMENINVLKHCQTKEEIKRLKEELKNITDMNKKIEIVTKIQELKKEVEV